ncbi:MAG: 2-C-methyl-D-erythritol 4-phosphate cytidylyltransferase, partial [Acidimicrobiia bacterium]|nr:2-C-methyl-D-erythritol 4-phosphate cytidylyltransferase [Acidimicrobiia bacterium]
ELDVVLVHDGARPFVTAALVDRLLAAVPQTGAAIPGLAPSPGLVAVDIDGEVTPAVTADLRQVQTPQAFDARALAAAFDTAALPELEATDTAELVRRAGGPSAVVVDGDPSNIKVTTPADVALAETIAAAQAD